MFGMWVAVAVAVSGLQGEPRELTLTLTEQGFSPENVRVEKGQPLRLVVTRKAEGGCATEIRIKDGNLHEELPLGKPVKLEFIPQRSGELRYACATGRHGGVLLVE